MQGDRLGRGDAKAPGMLLLGGVHAREWGSPDILLVFRRAVAFSLACRERDSDR